ncbi:MAG: hypothetical protein ACE5FP_03710 [Gemmatimonadota bacterium]
MIRIDVRRRRAWCLEAVTLVAALAVACDDGSQARADQRRALEQRREQLVIQNVSVQNQIRSVQGQALDEPGVVAVQARFYDVLRARMIELDPGAESMLDRAKQVGADLERLSGPVLLGPGDEPPPAGERAAVGRELAELERAMRPLQSEALKDPLVAATFLELQDSVKATIVRLDPNAAQVLENIKAVEDAIRELDVQIAALED